MTMDDLDEEDRAFLDSLTPEGAMALGLVAIVPIITSEGRQKIMVYQQTAPSTTLVEALGWIEGAKVEMVERTLRYGGDE